MTDEDKTPHAAKCHCSHVSVIIVDFKRLEKLAWIFITLVAGLGLHAVAGAMGSHVSPAPSVGHQGERLYEDRVEEPQR